MEERPFNHIGFAAWLNEGKLMGSRCRSCGETHLPPRAMCPNCYSTQMEWRELSGEGVLEAFTFIHVGLPVMLAEGYSREKPYCSGVVRLDEGPSISAQILPPEGAGDERIRVGLPVRVVFLERGEEESRQTVLAFQGK